MYRLTCWSNLPLHQPLVGGARTTLDLCLIPYLLVHECNNLVDTESYLANHMQLGYHQSSLHKIPVVKKMAPSNSKAKRLI